MDTQSTGMVNLLAQFLNSVNPTLSWETKVFQKQSLPSSIRFRIGAGVAYFLRESLRLAGAKLYFSLVAEEWLEFEFREPQVSPPLPAKMGALGTLYPINQSISEPEMGVGSVGMGLMGDTLIEVELSLEGIQFFDMLNLHKKDAAS